jgi:hypothetical protein
MSQELTGFNLEVDECAKEPLRWGSTSGLFPAMYLTYSSYTLKMEAVCLS